MIKFYYQKQFTITKRNKIKQWIQSSIHILNKQLGEINYVFCDNSYIHDLNLKHLNHDYTTDIITFDYSENNILNGEIYVSIDEINYNSKIYHTPFVDELHRVIIHGVLHLAGYNDKTEPEKLVMRNQEDYFLSLRNF